MATEQKPDWFRRLSDEFAEGMATNLEANDKNRDAVDEAAFKRSLQATPLEGTEDGGEETAEPQQKEKGGRIPPSPFRRQER